MAVFFLKRAAPDIEAQTLAMAAVASIAAEEISDADTNETETNDGGN